MTVRPGARCGRPVTADRPGCAPNQECLNKEPPDIPCPGAWVNLSRRLVFGLAVALVSGIAPAISPFTAAPWLVPASQAWAEDGAKPDSPYEALCKRHNLRCALTYGERAVDVKPSTTFTPPQTTTPAGGLAALVVVLLGLLLAIGLWMRFGNGGVLLSRAPRDAQQQEGDVPDDWRASPAQAEETIGQFMQRISAMPDRRAALVHLLRRCLLHAADISGTRLYRHDTERAVLSRLPADMTGRAELGTLLAQTELAHYGGRPVAESQFTALLAAARPLLSDGRIAHG